MSDLHRILLKLLMSPRRLQSGTSMSQFWVTRKVSAWLSFGQKVHGAGKANTLGNSSQNWILTFFGLGCPWWSQLPVFCLGIQLQKAGRRAIGHRKCLFSVWTGWEKKTLVNQQGLGRKAVHFKAAPHFSPLHLTATRWIFLVTVTNTWTDGSVSSVS